MSRKDHILPQKIKQLESYYDRSLTDIFRLGRIINAMKVAHYKSKFNEDILIQ